MIGKINVRWIPLVQGIYLMITALWPLLDINSFMRMTGRKTDIWLVKSVSVLLLSLVIILWKAALKPQPIPLSNAAAVMVGTGGLAAVEFSYYFNGTISRIYMIDAIIEMFFLLWWIVVFMNSLPRNRENQTY